MPVYPRQPLERRSSTRADRVECESVKFRVGGVARRRGWFVGCRQRECQANADRSFPFHVGGLNVHTQQSWIQMMMTAMDAPGWFLHKAIPPHQSLGGRVQSSQHNIHKNVAVRVPPCAEGRLPFPVLEMGEGGREHLREGKLLKKGPKKEEAVPHVFNLFKAC